MQGVMCGSWKTVTIHCTRFVVVVQTSCKHLYIFDCHVRVPWMRNLYFLFVHRPGTELGDDVAPYHCQILIPDNGLLCLIPGNGLLIAGIIRLFDR